MELEDSIKVVLRILPNDKQEMTAAPPKQANKFLAVRPSDTLGTKTAEDNKSMSHGRNSIWDQNRTRRQVVRSLHGLAGLGFFGWCMTSRARASEMEATLAELMRYLSEQG